MSTGRFEARDLNPYYEAIWNEFLETTDIEREIEEHRTNRKRFHSLIGVCIEQSSSPQPRILEIGSGTAIDSYILAEKHDVSVIGIDISRPSLEVARRVGQYFSRPITLVEGDGEHLPFADGSFDLIFSQGVVEHFRDPREMLKEQIRVLKPDGFLVINVPQRMSGYTVFKRKQIEAGTWPWGWETSYSYGQLRRLGRQFNLRAVAVMGYQYWGSRRGIVFWRHLHTKLQDRNPWKQLAPCVWMASMYERLWTALEHRFGHYFLVQITVVFQHRMVARRLPDVRP
jgi:ubiquinone/menaquinone biosynthesis C-methylase UbiE